MKVVVSPLYTWEANFCGNKQDLHISEVRKGFPVIFFQAFNASLASFLTSFSGYGLKNAALTKALQKEQLSGCQSTMSPGMSCLQAACCLQCRCPYPLK